MKGSIYKKPQWRQVSGQLENQSCNLNWHYIHLENKSNKKMIKKQVIKGLKRKKKYLHKLVWPTTLALNSNYNGEAHEFN